jgi:hypothetical protein
MRKIIFIAAAAALILTTSVGEWVASTTATTGLSMFTTSAEGLRWAAAPSSCRRSTRAFST